MPQIDLQAIELISVLRAEIVALAKRVVALEYMLGERIVDDSPETVRPHKVFEKEKVLEK